MCTSPVLGSSSLPLCAASLEVKVAPLPLQLPQRSPGGLALGIPVVENQALRWPWLTNVYVKRKITNWRSFDDIAKSVRIAYIRRARYDSLLEEYYQRECDRDPLPPWIQQIYKKEQVSKMTKEIVHRYAKDCNMTENCTRSWLNHKGDVKFVQLSRVTREWLEECLELAATAPTP